MFRTYDSECAASLKLECQHYGCEGNGASLFETDHLLVETDQLSI